MEKYIPLEKRSKKEQRRYHAAGRNDWNGVVPVTRSIPNKKKRGENTREALKREGAC